MSITDSIQLQTEEKLMNGPDCAAEPVQMTQVQDHFAILESAISRAEDLAGVVRQKLSSVLTEPLDTAKEGACIDPPLVPMASIIRGFTVRTNAIADILADVIERMEL